MTDTAELSRALGSASPRAGRDQKRCACAWRSPEYSTQGGHAGSDPPKVRLWPMSDCGSERGPRRHRNCFVQLVFRGTYELPPNVCPRKMPRSQISIHNMKKKIDPHPHPSPIHLAACPPPRSGGANFFQEAILFPQHTRLISATQHNGREGARESHRSAGDNTPQGFA